MGSINPVFLLPGKVAADAESLAQQLAASITLGMGQFCTQPGLIVAIDTEPLNRFIHCLKKEIENVIPSAMLHEGIAEKYTQNLSSALTQKGVQLVGEALTAAIPGQGQITLATATAPTFLGHPLLHEEVFGPYSLIIQCKDEIELLAVAKAIKGQLTTTLMATDKDLELHGELIDQVQELCGRLIFNNVPTGVEVALSMHHGGPFPASTDSRFTAVGADAIKRFVRPLCYQNCPDEFLPDELKNDNPLELWRTVNNVLTKEKI
ncbi:Alpha-ketoglutaric semialdehyde dehydrogenase [compost metagenome]